MESIKNNIKTGIVHSNILNVLNKISQKRITILRYHSIEDIPDDSDNTIGRSITHSTSVFKTHMKLISQAYDPISLDDVFEFLIGDKDLSDKSVVVTFDDGYKNNLEIAAPILNHYEVPATFYISVQSIIDQIAPFFVRVRYAIWNTKIKQWYEPIDGQLFKLESREDRLKVLRLVNNLCLKKFGVEQEEFIKDIETKLEVDVNKMPPLMMNWEEVKKLHHMGHMIGSHGLTHPNLVYLPNAIQEKEIVESKKILEEKIGSKIEHFSYPNPGLTPQWDERTNNILKDTGYKTAVNSTFGSVKKQSDRYILNRMSVPDSATEFLWYLGNTFIGRNL